MDDGVGKLCVDAHYPVRVSAIILFLKNSQYLELETAVLKCDILLDDRERQFFELMLQLDSILWDFWSTSKRGINLQTNFYSMMTKKFNYQDLTKLYSKNLIKNDKASKKSFNLVFLIPYLILAVLAAPVLCANQICNMSAIHYNCNGQGEPASSYKDFYE